MKKNLMIDKEEKNEKRIFKLNVVTRRRHKKLKRRNKCARFFTLTCRLKCVCKNYC